MWLFPAPPFFFLQLDICTDRIKEWLFHEGAHLKWSLPYYTWLPVFWGVTLSDTHFYSFPILFDYILNVGVFRLKLNWPCFSTLLKSLPAIGDHSVILWINSFKCFKTRCANSREWKLVLFGFSLYRCIHYLVFPPKKSLLCL